MQKIKRVGVLSVAKVFGVMGFIFGLIIGLMFFMFSSFIAVLDKQSDVPSMLFAGLGFFMVILLPILYGVVGFVSGAISAWMYNIVIKLAGGIEIELG